MKWYRICLGACNHHKIVWEFNEDVIKLDRVTSDAYQALAKIPRRRLKVEIGSWRVVTNGQPVRLLPPKRRFV